MINLEIVNYFKDANLMSPDRFHWFGWHFINKRPLAIDIYRTLDLLDRRAPGIARNVANRMGQLGGQPYNTDHYEQLIQILCELVIARRLCEIFTHELGFHLTWEPTGKSKKNPELMLCGPDFRLLVEVKCPSLLKHLKSAKDNDLQITARFATKDQLATLTKGEAFTKPLDNRIKDFLSSAEDKFVGFEDEAIPTYKILAICWDQRMFEPIAALNHPSSGLFTENSYLRDDAGKAVTFPHVDGVVITHHFDPLCAATREERVYGTYKSPLDYGSHHPTETIHPPVYVSNPASPLQLPEAVLSAFEAVLAEDVLDPMAKPLDMIFWLPRS